MTGDGFPYPVDRPGNFAAERKQTIAEQDDAERVPTSSTPGSCPNGPSVSPSVLPDGDPSRGPADPYRYSVILKWSDEDQTFVGRVPELPGCCFHGDTQVEAIGEAASAIACWIEAAWAAGNMIPEAARLSDADFPKWSPASGTDARSAETRSGSVEDEGPARRETPTPIPEQTGGE